MIARETQLQTLWRRLHEEKVISQTDVMMKRNSTRIMLILVTAQPVKSPFSATSHSRLHFFLLLLTPQSEKENLEIADNRLIFNTAKLACSISDSQSKCSRSFKKTSASQATNLMKRTLTPSAITKRIALAWN
jgi:hypothetical protein